MKNDATFEKIEAWLSGELSESAAGAFEAEIANDTALATEVERHRRGREALERLAEQAIQGDMAAWRESLDEVPEPPADSLPTAGTSNKLRWILGGLLLILLGGAAYWFWPSENIQPGNPSVKENIPLQNKQDVPMAVTPPDKPVNQIKDSKQPSEKNSPRLIAMAETNLSELRGSILSNYKDQRGSEDDENPFFAAGLKAFLEGDSIEAKERLLQVPADNAYFSSAQEILAFIYLKEKAYPKAVRCYQVFASQSADPATDWRLLQFYLTDYQNHKADFSKKLGEIANPKYGHRYQKEAEKLRRELGKMGIK